MLSQQVRYYFLHVLLINGLMKRINPSVQETTNKNVEDNTANIITSTPASLPYFVDESTRMRNVEIQIII